MFVAPKIPVVIPVTKSVTLEKSKSWSILSHSVRQNRSSKIEKRKLQSKMRKCASQQKIKALRKSVIKVVFSLCMEKIYLNLQYLNNSNVTFINIIGNF